MPVPETYDATTLAAFMVAELNATGAALGLTADSAAIAEAVNEVDAMLADGLAGETDAVKVRAIARWQAWLAALNAATNDFDLSADGGGLKLNQRYQNLERRYGMAQAAALRYSEVVAALAGGGGTAYVTTISDTSSPYAAAATSEYA